MGKKDTQRIHSTNRVVKKRKRGCAELKTGEKESQEKR